MIALVVLLYALWGFTFTLGKIALFYATPFFIIGTRMMIGGALLGTYAYYSGIFKGVPARKDLTLFLQTMFFGIFFFYCARSWSLQYLTTTKAALLSNFSPFFTAIFSYIMHKERLTLTKIVGLGIGFFGVLPILIAQSPATESAGFRMFSFFSVPELVLLIAVASFSYSMVIMRTLVKHRDCSPILVNAFSMFTGGALAFMTSVGIQEKMITQQPLMFVVVISLQILVSNLICSNLQAFLMRHYSATFMALAGFISPLCAAFYGWLLLNEVITWHYLVSFLLVLAGLALYYYDELRSQSLEQSAV